MRRLNRWLDKIDYVLVRLAAATLFLMMMIIFLDATFRTFHNPLPGVMEISEEYLMPMMVYLGISFTLKEKGHITVDFLVEKLGKKGKNILVVFNNLVGLVFVIALGVTNFQEGLKHIANGTTSRGLLHYPIAPAIMIVSLGILIFSIRLIIETLNIIRGESGESESINLTLNDKNYSNREEVQ